MCGATAATECGKPRRAAPQRAPRQTKLRTHGRLSGNHSGTRSGAGGVLGGEQHSAPDVVSMAAALAGPRMSVRRGIACGDAGSGVAVFVQGLAEASVVRIGIEISGERTG